MLCPFSFPRGREDCYEFTSHAEHDACEVYSEVRTRKADREGSVAACLDWKIDVSCLLPPDCLLELSNSLCLVECERESDLFCFVLNLNPYWLVLNLVSNLIKN